MYSYLFIGLMAGIASSILFVSGSVGTSLSLLLYILAPLPLFICGLGWGAVSAAVGAIAGAVVCALVSNLMGAGVFLGTIAVLPVVLSHFALMSRARADDDDDDDDAPAATPAQRDWYPFGNLLLGIAGFAALLASVFVIFVMPATPELQTALELICDQLLSQNAELKAKLGGDEAVTRMATMFIETLPATFAAYTFVTSTVNLWLASKIIHASGRGIRPAFAMAPLAYPVLAAAALVVALSLTFTSGFVHTLALAASAALAMAFMLLGLVVIHALVPQTPARAVVLPLVYVALVVLLSYAYQGLALLGLAETIFGIRQRFAASRNSGGPGAPPPAKTP